jgi:inorganic triphosphatase YgiF
METELKFQVPAAQAAALQRALATATAQTTRLQAVYAETADHRLAAAGMALRLRKEGRVWVQTLKGRGDGLLQRLEHEVPLPPQRGAPQLDPQRHAGTPAGERLLQLLADGAALHELYRTDIRRLHRRVRHGGAVIEIAYDRGQLEAAGRRLAVCEIEFELVSGPPAALPALAQRWAARFGLWWDIRTKSERGMRLALGVERVPAVKAQAAAWREDADAQAVWAALLQSALAQALPNAAEIASGLAGPEHLHQLRVALRRLRTVLRLFGAWGGQTAAAQELETAWRAPFAELGAARDIDVQRLTLWPRLQAAGAPPAAWPADPARADEGELVRGPAFTALLLRTLALALAPAAAPVPGIDDAMASLLRLAWRAVKQDAAAFGQATPPAQQHRLRRRLKRLRYALELLLPRLRRKPARRLLAALAQAVDALGAMGDLQAAQARCQAQVAAEPAAWFAVGWLAAQQEPARDAANAALARLARAPAPRAR